MKTKEIKSISKEFASTNDFTLQRLVVADWKQERSISGLTKYIARNFDTMKPLKELLLRKGYKKSDFGTVQTPDFNFVLSHMSDFAKYVRVRVPNTDATAKPVYEFKLDSEGNKVHKSIYQLSVVLSELRKIESVTI